MKHRKTLIIILFTLLAQWTLAAETTINGVTYFLSKDLTAEVMASTRKGKLAIPQKINAKGKTYRVTSIGDLAFRGNTGLTEVIIPDGVESIGISVFEGCTALTSVQIPKSVVSIGSWCFQGCKSLAKIELPKRMSYLGVAAFHNCTSLQTIAIPRGITSIGESTFEGLV